MTAGFDIFEVEAAGTVVWRASAAAFEEAKDFVKKLASSGSQEYIILSAKTGKKVVIKADGSLVEGASSNT